MKLIKLYSDKESFKTIDFNPKGLSIIIGCKDLAGKRNIKDTYNGVGKTLMLYLINFCLASREIKAFKEKLPNWKFCLDFSINGKIYTACRDTSNQSVIYLDNEELSLEIFRRTLAKELFYLDENENIPNIKFRSLLAKFMRRSKDEYTNYAGVADRAVNQWDTVLILSYLLGLDFFKNLEKRQLKLKHDETIKAKSNIQDDPIIKDYFNFSGNVEIELVDLEDKITHLKNEIANFHIAENFHEIEQEADEKAAKIQAISNKEFSLSHSISQIEKSLDIKTDIDSEQVSKLYEEAGIQLPSLIKKKLEDVQNFHKSLLISRTERLIKEKERIEQQQKELEQTRKTLSREQDDLLKYLENKGALEERDALKQKLSDLERRKDTLFKGQRLINEYEIKKSEIKSTLDKESTETEKYLNSDDGKQIKDTNLRLFRRLANSFYKDKENGFTIENNTGVNQVRYTLNPRIDHDSSDGINEVKIFCFDWMLLLGQHRHQVRTLIHDSRLFDAMDDRQAATALRIAMEECEKNDMQYIVTFNEGKYKNIIKELEQHGFKAEAEKIEKSKVKELTDKSDETKILGIGVDLKYEQ